MTEKPKTMGERMLLVEDWIERHERTCGDRYRQQMVVFSVLISILIAVCGWGLNKVFDGQQEQMDMLRQRLEARP